MSTFLDESLGSESKSEINEKDDKRVDISSPLSVSSDSSLYGSDNLLDPVKKLEQENRMLLIQVESLKLRIKCLTEENKSLRTAYVAIQAKAEQEEEFISNTLLKQIEVLKKEKETLALKYEQEEECLTNELSRKLNQLVAEKVQLEKTMEHEQEALVSKLMRKIDKLESVTAIKQQNLDQLRKEKIELENTLEQEQEALVNKLWKRMEKLENEKRNLQKKLEDFDKSEDCSPATSSPAPPPCQSDSLKHQRN